MKHLQSHITVTACVLLSALLVAGCSESPQEKYKDATSKLADAKKTRKEAREDVKDAQQKLKKAQDKLQDARQKVIATTQSVNKTVNDEVLFRTLQRNLLNKDKFSDAAISVGVNNRVVTLTGTVPDQETHKQAVQVAKNQAGVASVNDQLKVSKAQNGAPKPSDDAADHSASPKSDGGQHQSQKSGQGDQDKPQQTQKDGQNGQS